MEERQAGITALITAYARAYHATHDSPKIFDDFLADQYYTREEHILFDQNLAGLLQMVDPDLAATYPDQAAALAAVIQLHNGPITLSRSRYTEDCLEQAVSQGLRQYVILGAGMDTFAFRRPDLEQVQVFEVDHPVTQALKIERIAMAGWQIPARLHFIPVDFSKQSMTDALRRSSFDSHLTSFFSWLGVTYYLPREVIFTTLQAIAASAAAGSELVFDYMDADAFIPEKTAGRMRLMQRIAGQVGEPMKTGFDPITLATDLENVGLHLEENLDPAKIQAVYFEGRSDRYRAYEHVHFARARII